MDLNNSFRVAAPVQQAWEVLTDVERVAPCLPGAHLTGTEREDYLGMVKVKVGPIRAQYKGAARFIETDQDARRIVMRGEGRDTRGQGTARATISLELSPDGDATQVDVHTELQITGKVAQFGRNVLADVSDRLIGQFAQNLENEVVGGRPEPTDTGISTSGPTESAATRPAKERTPSVGEDPYLDLLNAAGGGLARRALPYGAALIALLLGWLLGRRPR